jgi:hypothetical protein
MGKRSRDKGIREERVIRKIFNDAGIKCRRVPLSGACEGFKGDLIAEYGGDTVQIESKVRANGFRQVYGWLEGNDLLVIKADRKEHLVVLPLKAYLRDIV